MAAFVIFFIFVALAMPVMAEWTSHPRPEAGALVDQGQDPERFEVAGETVSINQTLATCARVKFEEEPQFSSHCGRPLSPPSPPPLPFDPEQAAEAAGLLGLVAAQDSQQLRHRRRERAAEACPIVLGKASVRGYDERLVGAATVAQRDELCACVVGAGVTTHDSTIIDYVIDNNGRVIHAQGHGSRGARQMSLCMAEVVEGWSFPEAHICSYGVVEQQITLSRSNLLPPGPA